MAPVKATSVGVAPQIIDDIKLVHLLERLNSFEIHITPSSEMAADQPQSLPPLNIDALISELNPYPSWRFEEQVDLYEWIHPLNVIDAALSYLMSRYPNLFLIRQLQKKEVLRVPKPNENIQPSLNQANSLQDIASVPESVVTTILILLRFLSCLLRNSTNKTVFNSAEELVDLLAAADDTIASYALEALCNLATPPSLHKQQAPEVQQHTSSLHNSKSNAHKRLVALARGWGSRGSGLGLYGCITADDSEHGQGTLPVEAGELTFEFFSSKHTASDGSVEMMETTALDASGPRQESSSALATSASLLVQIHLSAQDIEDCSIGGDDPRNIKEHEMQDANTAMESSKQKRRKTENARLGRKGMETKATSELFFRCLEQAGGRQCIPEDRLFPLLADIRLAKAFHSNSSRVDAVESRLRALTTVLHSHPSQDVMTGYFHAQPELCIELIDLLRPTVSSASVSSGSFRLKDGSGASYAARHVGNISSLSTLAQSPGVPYTVRTLSLEALTALVARRDNANGGLAGGARQSNVLNELGVAKGQYLGPLPTLIRYSLASLSSFLSNATATEGPEAAQKNTFDTAEDSLALDIGFAFVEASKPPALSRRIQLERALEFIDSVLTLTSAVVSAPSGTASLTDGGLIPSLLSIVAANSNTIVSDDDVTIADDASHSTCLLRFIAAQAIQIIEGAIVTHNNALSAFHDLQGVHILINRLHSEIEEVRSGKVSSDSEFPMDCEPTSSPVAVPSTLQGHDTDRQSAGGRSGHPILRSSRRVLLFSIVNCLTVVFHQESTSSSSITPSGGSQLRKPELTNALKDIMGNVPIYGGVLAALTASLLSDVMNSDPHVVHHVHQSGLARSFLDMIMGQPTTSPDQTGDSNNWTAILPPVPELIMAIPNVISALALTEDGAKEILKADPFPALLSVFYHSKYAMPESRCLLNELTAIVGTGLDEIMRHVPALRPLVMSALVNAMRRVVTIGNELAKTEESIEHTKSGKEMNIVASEIQRTCLMQYALNFGQMLEQILHNEDHCEPFVNAGGLDAILDLCPLLMPTDSDFLAHVSCLSCTSVCTLNHSTTEESLTIAFKSIALHCDTQTILAKMVSSVHKRLDQLEESQKEVRCAFPASSYEGESKGSDLFLNGILDGIPRKQLYDIPRTPEFLIQAKSLSVYLKNVITIQWLTNLLAGVIRAGCQRSLEGGSSWGRSEQEWKKELSSEPFKNLVQRLSVFHQFALLESCRIRTESGFDSREKERLTPGKQTSKQTRYKLRIVCQEGAIVRDGIEIDSCSSVGTMEMGEIVEAFDRCVNTSGVLRYRTQRGWISELTRGHGREPIAEVIRVWTKNDAEERNNLMVKRVECGIPDLCSVSASILARLQNSYSELFSSLNKLVVQGVRGLPARSLSFAEGSVGAHVRASITLMTSNIEKGFNQEPIKAIVNSTFESKKDVHPRSDFISKAGAAMYLGCMFNHLHSCLFEERRERRVINIPILLFLMQSGRISNAPHDPSCEENAPSVHFITALNFVFNQSLVDLTGTSDRPVVTPTKEENGKLIEAAQTPHQSVSRSVAASLPPSIALLRRLMMGILTSPLTSIVSRFKGRDLLSLLGPTSFSGIQTIENAKEDIEDIPFHPERFVRALHCNIAEEILKIWTDPRLLCVPSHILHPLTLLAGEIIVGMEESTKTPGTKPGNGPNSVTGDRAQSNQLDIFPRTMRRQHLAFSGRDSDGGVASSLAREEHFEPNEETISRLIEMGFNRDHALDAMESTESNRLELAMEYALSHPPPSPEAIERRRVVREERQREREEDHVQSAEGEINVSTVESEAASTPSDPQGVPSLPSNESTAENRRETESMDVDESSSPEVLAGRTADQVEVAAKEDGHDNDRLVTDRLQSCLRSWIEQSSVVSFNLLSGVQDNKGVISTSRWYDDGKGTGNGEAEAYTVVLSSFLLDLSQRYSTDRPNVIRQLCEQLKSQLHETTSAGCTEYRVISGREHSFAALCHSVVIFMRALPTARAFLLEHGLVGRLVSCVQSFIATRSIKSADVAKAVEWAMWLAPALLLLDVMAQPLAAFTDSELVAVGESVETGKHTELEQVRIEHKKQATALSETAQLIFCNARNYSNETNAASGDSGKSEADNEKKRKLTTNTEANDEKGKELSSETPFSLVPPYFPLITLETSEACLTICLTLLGKGQTGTDAEKCCPPPGIVHAVLLLLSRVIRTPKIASRCLRMGAAELIMSLPKACRFAGNSGLVTVILRRLLEDEVTLQASMETEIRGTVTKLVRKQRRGFARKDEKPNVPCRVFMQAVTPLVCRDPMTFLKAAALSIIIEPDFTNQPNSQPRISLVSVDERSCAIKALGGAVPQISGVPVKSLSSKIDFVKNSTPKRGRIPHSSIKPSKSKSPHRSSLHKRSSNPKKNKKEKNDAGTTGKKYIVLNGTPVNHITSMLALKMMILCQGNIYPINENNLQATAGYCEKQFGEGTSFLWIADILEILADLVLAIPSCAAAIHKFRPVGNKDRSSKSGPILNLNHALSGCPPPPKSVINFLLHSLLPQNRWASKKDREDDKATNDEVRDEQQRQRKSSFIKSKVSQSSGRLLVALVARPGEGRRRVVADLAFALSGGRLGSTSNPCPSVPSTLENVGSGEKECYALKAWGELSIGLAAPRSSGINHDHSSSLSFEMVKLMLDYGMAHALMYGIQRVNLQHPMAASICGALLVPLEVFTRGNVTDKLQGMADKEAADRKKASIIDDSDLNPKITKEKEASDSSGTGNVQRSDVPFVDDAMIEDGFDAETAARNARNRGDTIGFGEGAMFDVNDVRDLGEMDDSIGEYDGSSSETENEDDVEMEDGDDEEVNESEDEDVTSDDESNESNEDSDESEEDEDSNDESENEDDVDMGEIENDDIDTGWNDQYNGDLFDGGIDGDVHEEDVEDPLVGGPTDTELEEGWTRVESEGLGSITIGGRQNARSGTVGNSARGFIDVAEAMIGTLLRTGEIQGNALSEIEDAIGIRIMHNRNGPEIGNSGQREGNWPRSLNTSRSDGAVSDRSASQRAQDEGIAGTLPHVHQRNPPDIGYSAFGGGAREISSMEYVFGGPCVAGGSRNYDVVSPPIQADPETYPQPSPLDAQLFPGGPAASTHARTRQSLHPLLCGVDLPPVNTLVSDLLPHGVRELNRSQVNTRRHGEWSGAQASSGGYLVSTSNGNVVRLNRGQIGAPATDNALTQERAGGALVGWTDDGLPFDGTVREFSSAFGRAFEESMVAGLGRNEESNRQVGPSSSTTAALPLRRLPPEVLPAEESAGMTVPSTGVTTAGGGEHNRPIPSGSTSSPPLNRSLSETLPVTSVTVQGSSDRENLEVTGNVGAEGNSATSEGDGMASSLASGLRLSPQSEGSTHLDQMSTENGSTEQNQQGIAPSALEENTEQDDALPASGETEPAVSDADISGGEAENEPNGNGLVCPPGMDLEVFNSLPLEMQQEVVQQNQTSTELAAQLDSTSALDPEVLAALPEGMRQEVIAQEQEERRLREQTPADPSNAEEMDNANFVASLSPDLREEILLTADDAFLGSLPSNIIAEAQVLRERASAQSRRFQQDPTAAGTSARVASTAGNNGTSEIPPRGGADGGPTETTSNNSNARKRQRIGKLRAECDRYRIVYLPLAGAKQLSPLLATSEMKFLIRLMYLLSPVRPQRLLQKVFQNLCSNSILRGVLTTTFVSLLNNDVNGARAAFTTLEKDYCDVGDWRKEIDEEFAASADNFPPSILIGAAPEVLYSEALNPSMAMFRRRPGTICADSIAASLPTSARGSTRDQYTPPVVATRIVDVLSHLSRNSPRACIDVLANESIPEGGSERNGNCSTCFDKLLDLLEKPLYSKSSSNLEQLLSLLESFVSPLSLLPKDVDEDQEVSQKDLNAAAQAGKEWVDVPRIAVAQSRLQLLCSVLRMESCRDSAFVKVNTIARRLCRIEANRGCILGELASVAQALGADAIRDLRALNIRMNDAVTLHRKQEPSASDRTEQGVDPNSTISRMQAGGSASSSVTLSTSTSEVKLLRVLQTLQSLCVEASHDEHSVKKQDGNFIVTEELVELLHGMNLDNLWGQLSQCLKVVQVLEGVATLDDIGENDEREQGDTDGGGSDENPSGSKKLQNSVAGLITRFLPTIEAFFVVNASATRDTNAEILASTKAESQESNEQKKSNVSNIDSAPGNVLQNGVSDDNALDYLVGGRRLVDFVVANKVLLNALIRNNPSLIEKGLRAMVQIPRCRVFLDFDVKRQWFKTQVRRLRQHASRRHGSVRLSIRRKHVFEDAYHQLRIRNADEMRGRLHITFRNEEGVDAGGLSREFFGILAKEIFNPNYALFTSTEDGCTFQPNQHSSINPDHLSYFRFVGRIVGKAIADGFLLDAHFTRSLYKHMLGLKPTHHDMEAIDPDYYKNLKMIMEYKLADIGLDLTFSTEDHSFGRSQIIDLLPGGRKIPVTEETKAEYVSLVCQHRMTTAIANQIKAYLDGFYEMVNADLIAIFTPKELELLISGLPDIDVHDLKKNTDYQGYKVADKEIQWFWNILFSLSRSEKAAFLQFVTGSSKVPLSGFSEIQGMRGVQKFSIHKAGGSRGALMSAHTCFNSLDLPVYSSEEEMRKKLLYAISEGATGFLFA